jgi:hypothetical protein
LLSLVHVLEWRAAVSPEAVALTDHQGARLTYAGLAAAMHRSAEDHDPTRGRLGTAGRSSLDWEVRLGERDEIHATGKLRATLREPFWAGRDRLVS